MINRFALLLVSVCAAGSAARAQELVVTLNPGETQIRWTLTDPLHTVHGTFALKQGDLKQGNIRFTPGTGAIAGKVVVDAASGKSGNGARDRRMHKDILQSDRYPLAVFTLTRLRGAIAAQGKSTGEIDGTFEIHGATHPLTLPVEVEIRGNRIAAKTHFAIPYVAWGMKDPSNFLLRVEPVVKVEVDAVGRIEAAP